MGRTYLEERDTSIRIHMEKQGYRTLEYLEQLQGKYKLSYLYKVDVLK